MTTPVKKVPIHLQSAQNRLLIKNGTVVNADGSSQVDVYMEDYMIRMVGKHLIIPGGTRVIDATGKYLLPGGIDSNVHFQMPTSTEGTSLSGGTRTIDDFYQGTKAAVSGGTTMVIDCVVPEKGESLIDAYNKWRSWGDDKVCCDYSLRVALPSTLTGQQKKDMQELTTADFGVNTFFFDMAPKDEIFSESDMMSAFGECSKLGCLAQVLAENQTLVERSTKDVLAQGAKGPEGFAYAHTESAEETATMSAAVMADQANCPVYITSISSAAAAKIVEAKKANGLVIIGETTAAYIACDGEAYNDPDWTKAASLITRPPIRVGQADDLISALNGDVEGSSALDILASNHTSYSSEQKALGVDDFTKIPVGVNGVEERMSLLWEKGVRTGKITPEEFVAITSANPAKVFNIFPEKGRIEVGSHADIVIWNPNGTKVFSKKTHNPKSNLNIFDGIECHGIPETVIVQGRVVLDEGHLRAMQGLGKFVPLPPFSPHIYEKVRQRQAAPLQTRNTRPIVRSSIPEVANGHNVPAPVTDEPAETPSSQPESVAEQSSPAEAAENGPRAVRVSVKIRAPPGGKSSGFW